MAKLIIFDMDQTLLDLVPFHDKTYSRVFKEIFGIDTTFNKIDHSGKSYPVITRELGVLEGIDSKKIEKNIPEVLSLFQKYFNEIVSKMKVEPLYGAKELLEKLSANKNNILVVASASPKQTVELSLKNAGLLHFFKEIKTANDAEVKKGIVQIIKNQSDKEEFEKSCKNSQTPHKNALNIASQNSYSKPSKNNQMKTFMIGDAVEDMDAGKNINATTIGITTGSHSEKELKMHGADFVFPKIEFNQIIKIIEEKIAE